MWDVRAAGSLEELWKIALAFLSVELSSERALVLHDAEGKMQFNVVGAREVDPAKVWSGDEVELSLLKQACKEHSLVTRNQDQRVVLCVPLVEQQSVIGLLYADRPLSEEVFHADELERVQNFAAALAARTAELTGTGPPRRVALEARPDPGPDSSRPRLSPLAFRRPQAGDSGGQQLVGGRFMLKRPMLVCRFSTLYEALDRATGTPLVLRKLEGSGDPNAREARLQTLREGRFLARLVHRNLPRVLEVIEDSGQVYLVLEEFSGQTLEDLITGSQTPLAAELLLRYLEQFLGVLTFLHGQDPPIVHRDLRPDSVLVTTHGVIKLAEFGLAKMRESSSDPKQTSFRALGSPFYAPPEQLLGEPTQPHNDIYAVGSILYFMATGSVPAKSVDRWYGATNLPSLGELRPDLSPALVVLIESMMEGEASRRLQSVAQVQQRLDHLLQESPEPSGMEEVAVEAPEVGAGQPDLPTDVPATRVEDAAPSVSEGGDLPRTDFQLPKAGRETRRISRSPARPRGMFSRFKLEAWKLLMGKKGGDDEVVILEEETGEVEFHSDLGRHGNVDLRSMQLDRDLARLLSETVARSIQGVCIGQPGPNELLVAVKDPTEVHIYDHISLATQGQYRAKLVGADLQLIDLALEYIYRTGTLAEDIPWLEWLERKSFETETLEVANPMADVAYGLDEITSPIIAQVDKLIKEAISVGASDIHMEMYEHEMNLRYRIDGQLHHINTFAHHEASAMVKRLKVMANMDIAQEKVCQGGRISLKVGGQELDLRVSVVPVPNGESVVMRLLKKGAFNLTLQDLGFSEYTLERFLRVLAQPYGMILVCGPTGSGKSTTLYASLKQIQRPDRKLLTVEDPIEYQMPGICQVQVNMAPREEEKKVTFARVLREFLRQDPDVILVGEIRDIETAAIAVQAALTGHLLLSTIHTNDSVGIVARLTDMRVEPFLIGSTLLGGLAQRLARRICSHCREEIRVTDELKRIFDEQGINAPPRMFRGHGCQKCHHTGARGRVGLYELLELTTEMRDLINRSALEEELRRTANEQGFRSLYYDGLLKVADGQVSLEEVQRVCKTI